MRKRSRVTGGPDVLMSPLIDCVFLLLIFFLVTSMLKRWERQIPVTLADPTASVSEQVRAEAYLLGLDEQGRVYDAVGRSDAGVTRFEPVADVSALLDRLIATRGGEARIELIVEEQTPFQTVIDVLDELQRAGLTRVRPRIRDGKL